MRVACFIALVLTAACTDLSGYSRGNGHTGITVHTSAAVITQIDPISEIEARAVVAESDKQRVFLIKTFVTRNDRNYPKISAAYASKRMLTYQRDDLRRRGRDRQETGHIPLTEGQFNSLANTGITFQLIGPRGTYTLNLPAIAFSEAISRADNAYVDNSGVGIATR